MRGILVHAEIDWRFKKKQADPFNLQGFFILRQIPNKYANKF